MITWKLSPRNMIPCLLVHLLISMVRPVDAKSAIEPKMLSASKGTFTFIIVQDGLSFPMTVWYCRPAKLETRTRVIFVMHGSKPETVEQVCEIVGSYSDRLRAVIVAPQFAAEYFPGDSYMFGNMLDKKGSISLKEQWGFSVVEHLFDALCGGLGLTNATYDIVGFSGGGQFVQRLVLFLPDARYRRAIAGSPGRYAFPTFANRFPYGLLDSPTKPSDLSRIFGRDFILLLGDADIVDRSREDEAVEQGTNRFARGLRFFAAATEEASNRGIPLRWQILILHGVDHNPPAVITSAFDLLAK
jgi:hypothetical protein